MLLDELMPEFTEIHSVRISAPPDRALEAVKPAPLGEMPLVRLLFAIRSLPARIWGKRGLPAEKATSLYGQMLHFGFTQLAEEPGRGVVRGHRADVRAARRPHAGRTVPALVSRPSRARLRQRVAMSFSAEAAEGGASLITETRVMTTDPASRRRFGRYWRVIRPGSAAVRRSWLAAAKPRAEEGRRGG